MEYLAARLAEIPGVVAVTLGGSRATNTAVEGSDWDFGLYYRGRLDPADIRALGWPGRVFAPGEWGRIVDGGAWLTVDGTKVDLIWRRLRAAWPPQASGPSTKSGLPNEPACTPSRTGSRSPTGT